MLLMACVESMKSLSASRGSISQAYSLATHPLTLGWRQPRGGYHVAAPSFGSWMMDSLSKATEVFGFR